MRLFPKFLSFFRRSKEAAPVTTQNPLHVVTPWAASYYDGNPLSVATVYRCVDVLSCSIACLGMHYLKRKDGVYIDDEASPFHYLLSVQPQPERSAFDFWYYAISRVLLIGNAYIYPRIVDGEITDLVLCDNNCVSHDAINGRYIISDPYNAVHGTFMENDVIHLFFHSRDGRHGESVLAHASRTIGIASAGDVETENRFTNGGTMRGIVSNGSTATGYGELQDRQLENVADDIDSRFLSGKRIVSLPGQVDFKQISLTSADMQFLESRKFTVREICRFFGVHPSYVFDDSSSNYKSTEMAFTAFLSMTLNPLLKRIEGEFNRKLIPRSQCCRRRFLFNRKGIYELDLLSRASYQKATIECGLYTVNDWRRMENQPDVDGGDSVLVSANLRRIDELCK